MTLAKNDCHDTTHEFMEQIEKERWASHMREHEQIAESLKQYKIESNEWRGALSDLRNTFVIREAYDNKHDSLEARTDALEKRIAFFEDREKGAQGILSGQRALIVTVAALMTTIITIILFFTER